VGIVYSSKKKRKCGRTALPFDDWRIGVSVRNGAA